jgi:FkbM family methyltransferase
VSVSSVGVTVGDRLDRQGPIVRMLRPVYSGCLRAAYGRRGLPWRINGEPIRIDPDLRHLMPPQNEPALFRYLQDGIQPGQVVLDVGSFLGFYAISAARRVGPSGRVVAFEPTPWSFTALGRHAAMNGYRAPQLHLVEAAAGARRGQRELLVYSEEPYRNMVAPASENGAAVSVNVVTIDETCAALGRPPDWIRMDVQGLEFEVLEGAREILRERRGRVQIVAEMHPDQWKVYGIDPCDVRDRLAALGLRARSLVPGEPTFVQGAHAVLESLHSI